MLRIVSKPTSCNQPGRSYQASQVSANDILVQPHLFLPRCLQASAVNRISHAFPAFLLCPKTCTPIAVPLIWTGKFKAISVMAPLILEHRPPSINTSFHFPCQLSWLAYRPAATVLGEHKPAQQGC
ncbi:hypothetical protein JMJ77_0007646 [Colletotrichum scovillei]|uniref:Uncharacterized protein n=1 Tax=Colletotrichum scovillei TaxID=1209932 RepID=A0A9P7ULB4_9PEZI|nr:hypothetical protein JMJ77_0007646 [Colletotrichum scovillei]KAG7074596.1 hypothetical protein JMJ76_0011072 [Colletotrichum scovillei]KAG7081717.1 hypothetical protein JMJ78_0003832 [Colletotrichum scovillei]